MNKKFLNILLILIVSLSVLSGCSAGENNFFNDLDITAQSASDYANYDLFWLNKLKLTESKKNETIELFKEYEIKYFESEKFFFGIAEIDLYTGWTEKYNNEKITEFENWYPDFKYPF